LSAIAECDRIGRDAFLEGNGFREAVEYYLLYGGNVYDSKAIIGVAHRFDTGATVRSADFTGGQGVAARLGELGFTVTGDADWRWFELVVAADILHMNGWRRTLRAHEPQVVELSQYLRGQKPELGEAKRYRSPGSVQRKLEDLRTVHPEYGGRSTKGSRLTVATVETFIAEPGRMHRLAQAIRGVGGWDALEADTAETESDVFASDDPATFASSTEGRVLRRLVTTRERDPKLRRWKITQARADRGDIACEACGFDFEQTYGELGEGFIHVHHVIPLHFSGVVDTRLDDLALLCANCHQMVHRGRPRWKTPAELRNILVERRTQSNSPDGSI
jgi:5-methylcytosine-specific restriction protein A